MGESRQALIIAVPKYELADVFEDLTDTVGRDVVLMTEALRSSGYSVEVIGATPDDPAQGPRIRSAVSRVCATAPEDGTVLIHFTGHGLSLDGADFLVPADAQLTWATTPPQVDADSLIGLDLAKLLKGCRAGTVLLTVDACRDAATPSSFGGSSTSFPAGRDRIAVLFGCDQGQTCGSDEKLGSHFSRALAEALHADSSPRTVADIIAHTSRRTAEFARAAREKQTPRPHFAPSGPRAVEEVTLCAGRTLQEEWTLAVRDSELWAAVSCDDERRAELQRALVQLAGDCARWCATVSNRVPDPWADDDYPVRVLTKGLRPLVAPSQTQGGPLLDAGELAALAAAPFVREAVYSMGVKGTIAVDPYRLTRATGDLARDPERVDLEHTFAAHALLWRKGRELAGRGRAEDAAAVAAWLVRRHVSAKEELWDAYAPQLLAPLARAMTGAAAPESRIGELTDELVRVCRQTALAPARPYQGDPEPSDARWRLDELDRADGAPERWRPRELSWLIGVAGLLGGDLRQLPGVLVDNIGITDGLVSVDAVESVRRLRWARDRLNKTLDLALDCPHPAVHAALETLTGWTDDAVQTIRQHVAPAEPGGLLAHLPVRVTCRRLRPQYDVRTKDRAYGTPLMRFGLAEDEIRELLMGNRLYGDPTLAMRELYQNALDACRYRQARVRFGRAAQKIPYTWAGEIVFRSGTDDEGRPYVECEDNGVGMGHETLRNTFARAGRRFEQSREYRREQARWRRADPALRIYPNSRFGIGVFSYFMLADEISIWTRATDEYGRATADGGLRVDIASSGSLFRIRRSEEAQPTGGTRVRLYVQGDGVDVADVLGKHVWRSDFGMRVETDREVVRVWEEKALYYFGDSRRPVPAGPDMWWVEGEGCLLADGVLVDAEGMFGDRAENARVWLEKNRSSYAPSEEDPDWHVMGGRPFGCVVDLRETHVPDLSTNRNDILSYDREWVDSRIHEACATFEAPEWLTLEWLWAFARRHPGAIGRVTEQLLAADARISSRLGWNTAVAVDFRSVGCFPPDERLAALDDEFARFITDFVGAQPLEAWRAAVLRKSGLSVRTRIRALPIPVTVAGYPEPQAWESRIRVSSFVDWDIVRDAVVLSEPDEILTLGGVLRRLRPYAVLGLALPPLTDMDAAHRLALDSVDRRILKGDRYGFSFLEISDWESLGSELFTMEVFSAVPKLPLREALHRARRFAAAGFSLTLPDPAAEPPEDLVAALEDLRLLSLHPRFAESREGLRPDRKTVEKYAEALERYSWLALPPDSLPEPVVKPKWMNSDDLDDVLSPYDLEEFWRCFGVRLRSSEGVRLSLRQLVRASGLLGITVGEVVERYSGLMTAMGMETEDFGALADRVFTPLDGKLLGAALEHAFGQELDVAAYPASLLETAVAVCKVQAETQDVVERLQELSAIGLVDAAAPSLAERWRALPSSDWELVPVDDSLPEFRAGLAEAGRATARGEFDLRYVFVVSGHTGRTLGKAVARLVELGPLLGFDASSLALPPGTALARSRPTSADVDACCSFDYQDSRFHWNPPTPAALVAHARSDDLTLGESMAVLCRYAPLGVLWKQPEDADGPWREHRPDAYDSALFEPDLLGESREVGPLNLLRVAARFGWSLDQAWDRLALYRPLGLELLVGRPDIDDVPLWQDLILLSEYYTGGAPALTGRVTSERIAVAARELEQPTAWIHERLRRYAQLFALEVPHDHPAEPAPTPAPEFYEPPDAPREDAA
ncbi:HD domain-containing protein [Streptomyces sp. KR55]|uniref:HD domain-containing protein n=1 Tax=Streptomyces sp. KR55 TaxID=3457425 RepID=UPI003FCFB173